MSDIIKQNLLKYFPDKDEVKTILKDLGLSDEEIEERLSCNLNEILIYETAHRIIDDLSSLSDKILEKFAKIMNVTDNRFAFKTEFLFRAVYFLKKKAYGQFIIEREGELIQEISQSGFGIKSDVPELTNEMIRYLMKVIIYTNCDKTLILKAVSQWEQKFKQLIRSRSTRIAIPCAFNKKLSEYKTLNDCVRGMLVYNMLIGQEYFKPGMKGFKIYCKGVDLKQLNISPSELTTRLRNFAQQFNIQKKNLMEILDRITIPDTMDTIPEWIIIDENVLLEKIFRNKVNELLEPIGITIVSDASSAILSELF
jgi:transcriptional regulator with XRE-family HTH domain